MTDQVTETAAGLDKAKADLAAAETAHAAATAAAAGPREPAAIVTDLLTRIVARLGNPPELEKRVLELTAATAKTPAAAAE